jgi:hypothetical protein
VSELDLKSFALLAELTVADREELLEILEPQSMHADRTLFREGQQSDGLVLLVDGTAQVESKATGMSVRIGAGTSFGAISLVEVGVRESTVITETPCEILWLRRSEFRRLAEDSPRAACRLLEAIASDFAGRVRVELARFAGARSVTQDGVLGFGQAELAKRDPRAAAVFVVPPRDRAPAGIRDPSPASARCADMGAGVNWVVTPAHEAPFPP